MSATGLTVASLLQAVIPHPAIGQLPLLPKYDGGQASALAFMEIPETAPPTRNVLRLWRSDWNVDGVPVWYGAFYRETQVRPNLSFLRQQGASADGFNGLLIKAGMRRINEGTPDLAGHPQLWSCK